MTDSFRDKFLTNIAKTLGVSAADMSADYERRYSQGALYERALRQQEAIRRQATTWADILYDKYVTDAVMRAYIKLPLADEIRYITGYHPQRLLPAPSKPIDLWGPKVQELLSTPTSEWFLDKFFPNVMSEFIDFEPVPKLTRYYIEGGHFDMYDREPRRIAPFVKPAAMGKTFYPAAFDEFDKAFPHLAAEDDRRMAEFSAITGRRRREPTFITPTGRISYPHIKPSEAMKEGAKSHMAIIAGADYATIELQMLSAMQMPSVRCLVLDLDSPGGETRGNPQQELYASLLGGLKPIHEDVVDTAAGKRDKSYLKHDPSKSHKRRKRK